jgi:hypothetical protein
MSDIITRVHSDPSERKYHFERFQDVEDIVENNKRLQSIEQKSDWGRHVASVPLIFIEKELNREHARGNIHLRYLGPGFDDWYKRTFIDNPEYRDFRTDNPSNPFRIGYR